MAEVLIVDDDAVIRQILAALMDAEGHTPLEAADGHVGLALLLASPRPLVALVDQVMPGLRGTDILSLLFTQHPHVAARHRYAVFTTSPSGLSEADHTFLADRHIPVLGKLFDVDAVAALVTNLALGLEGP